MNTKHLTSIAALCFVITQLASACTIPVFRYALDRWPADQYGLAVNEEWARSDAGEALLKDIGDLARRFQFVPSDKTAGEMDLLIPARGSMPIWSGKADAAILKQLATSPARRELVAAILEGNSAVWVMVRGGDASADKAFEARLRKRLDYLQSVAAIPPQDPFDPESRLGPGPELKVGFKIVAIDRRDRAEQMFLKMIVGPDGESFLESDLPFAAPVFGRGRVLGAFTAEQLDEEGIDELSLFLLGACSCQVKAQNPGWDLLLDTDWDTELTGIAMATERGEMPSIEEFKAETPELVVFKASSQDVALTPKGPSRELVLGLGLLSLLAIWFGWKSGN